MVHTKEMSASGQSEPGRGKEDEKGERSMLLDGEGLLKYAGHQPEAACSQRVSRKRQPVVE